MRAVVGRVAGLALALSMIGWGGASAAASDGEAAPDLSISLTSGSENVAAGDELVYAAEIVNRGDALEARVVLTPPPFVELGEASDGAVVEGNEATWNTTLDASGAVTLEIPATVGEIPEGELRATALISVYVGDATSPVVRTAAADPIAGVDDTQEVVAPQADLLPWIIAGAAVVLLIAAIVVMLLVRRRRRAEAPAAEPGYARLSTPEDAPADEDAALRVTPAELDPAL